MKASSEAAEDGLSLLTDFRVSPALTDSRQLWLTWSWQSATLVQQLFQQVKLIHRSEIDHRLLGEHVITDPTVQSYAITGLRPKVHYLVCLRLTRRRTSTSPSTDPSGASLMNVSGYVSEMECRLARTQGLHWPAFISCLLGILLALALALVVYGLARRWQVKTKARYHQELHYHSHHQRQASLQAHQRGSCGHRSSQMMVEKEGVQQVAGDHCAKHCPHRATQAILSRRQSHVTPGSDLENNRVAHRGTLEAIDGAVLEEPGGAHLPPPSSKQHVAMPSPVEASGNTPSPGPYSLSGSESYQITSTSSTTEEHGCCNSVETGSRQLKAGELSDDRQSRKLPANVQCPQSRRTVSFLVSEKSSSQGTTVSDKRRHIRPLSIRQSNGAGRSNFKVTSPNTNQLAESQFDFSHSSNDTFCPAHAPTNSRETNGSTPGNLTCTSPVVSVPDLISSPGVAPDRVDTGVPMTSAGSLTAFSSRKGQMEGDAVETTPVFYTQMIETI